MKNAVLIHGLNSSTKNLTKLQTYLQIRGFKVYKIDYEPSVDFFAMLADVQIKMPKLSSIDLVIGHSLGGMIARMLPFNAKKVILINSPLALPLGRSIEIQGILDPLAVFSFPTINFYVGGHSDFNSSLFAKLDELI